MAFDNCSTTSDTSLHYSCLIDWWWNWVFVIHSRTARGWGLDQGRNVCSHCLIKANNSIRVVNTALWRHLGIMQDCYTINSKLTLNITLNSSTVTVEYHNPMYVLKLQWNEIVVAMLPLLFIHDWFKVCPAPLRHGVAFHKVSHWLGASLKSTLYIGSNAPTNDRL